MVRRRNYWNIAEYSWPSSRPTSFLPSVRSRAFQNPSQLKHTSDYTMFNKGKFSPRPAHEVELQSNHVNAPYSNNKPIQESCFQSSPFSFLDIGKPKCFRTSDLKLAGASAVSQALRLGCPSPPAASNTFTRLLDRWKHGAIINVAPASLCSLLLLCCGTFCLESPVI